MSMAKAKARFGQLWQLWSSTAFPITAKIRLFGAAVVSILVYGSEAWQLDSKLEASLRDWCAKCMTLLLQVHQIELRPCRLVQLFLSQ